MITDNGFKMSVIAASRYWGLDMNDTNNPACLRVRTGKMLAQNFGYQYDPIGNRTSSKSGGTTSTSSAYTANNLNQYTERTVPGKFPMLGSAMEDAFVTVSLTNGTPSPVDRQGKYWHKALEVDNTASAVYPEIKVVGVYNPQSAGIPDIVSEEVGRKFITKTPEQFTYDADGNMTSDGRFDYTWDAENRLIAVEAESRSGVPAAFMKKLEFAYDYMSRRISKKLYRRQGNDWASAPQKEIAYIYDGWNLICESIRETKSSGGGGQGKGKGQGQGGSGGGGGGSVSISTNYYVWGLDLSGTIQGAGGIGGLLCVSQSGTGVSPVSFFSLADANGNVSELVSTNGAIAAHYEYSPFGEIIVATGSKKDDFPFRFSTKYLDAETGLYYYGYRYYSPTLGRFISRDPMPLGPFDIFHDYYFVQNRPIILIDVWGLGIREMSFTPDESHATIERYRPTLFPWLLQRYEQLSASKGSPDRKTWGSVAYDYSVSKPSFSADVSLMTDFSQVPSDTTSLSASASIKGTVKVKACCGSKKVDVAWRAKGSQNMGVTSKVEIGATKSTVTTYLTSANDTSFDEPDTLTIDLSGIDGSFWIFIYSAWVDMPPSTQKQTGSASITADLSCHY